jgi:hypothetical protein
LALPERPPERDDLDALLDALLPFAHEMLSKRGGFYPFGAVMKADGEVTMVAAYTGTEHPDSIDLIDSMRSGMRSQAASGEIRAAGVCYDVKVRSEGGKPADSIAVDLEHQAGDTVQILMPYSKPRFGSYRFGELSASSGERHIFV